LALLPTYLRPTLNDTSFTIAVWVDQPRSPGVVVGHGLGGLLGWQIIKGTFIIGGKRADETSTRQIQVSTEVDDHAKDGAWTHLVFTWDAERTVLSAYRDGQRWETKTIPEGLGDPDLGDRPMLLGGRDTGISPYYTGSVDDLRVYGRALTDLEIATLFETPVPAILAPAAPAKDDNKKAKDGTKPAKKPAASR
jgi:hypothetical protein